MIDKYSYTVAWSEQDEAYIGRVAEFPLLAAHGDTLEGVLREIETVVGYVIEDLRESGEPIPEPFSTGDVLDAGAERITRELADEPQARAELMTTLGEVYRKLGDYDRAESLVEEALAIRRRVLGRDGLPSA